MGHPTRASAGVRSPTMMTRGASHKGDRKGPHPTPLHPRPYNDDEREYFSWPDTLLKNEACDCWQSHQTVDNNETASYILNCSSMIAIVSKCIMARIVITQG